MALVAVASLFLLLQPQAAAQMRILPRAKVDSLVKAAEGPRYWASSFLECDPLCFDAGEVAENGGPVKVEFRLRNTGREDLLLGRIETSCSCVRATVSPSFLRRDSTAVVRAEYDPKGHPGVHPRYISLYLAAPIDTVVARLCITTLVR